MHIKSDKQRLKQILMNLLSNSLKFTDKGSIDVVFSKDLVKNSQSNLHEESKNFIEEDISCYDVNEGKASSNNL